MDTNTSPKSTFDDDVGSSPPSSDDRTRFYLALMVAILVIVLALTTVVEPTAGPVLDKVLPLLTMVLGFFFGREVQQVKS